MYDVRCVMISFRCFIILNETKRIEQQQQRKRKRKQIDSIDSKTKISKAIDSLIGYTYTRDDLLDYLSMCQMRMRR
jgi:hypothetical protein